MGAVIANSEPRTVTQTDGSVVTLVLHGDEHYNYTTTAAGYTVLYNDVTRNWEYARANADGTLALTGEIASDNITPRTGVRGLRPARPAASSRMKAPSPMLKLHGHGKFDISKFQGLVILVEFNDAPFSRDDAAEIFNDMVNKKGFDGFMSNTLIPSKIEYTGSVRDYYYDNSNGRFDPPFDVVGPVKIDYSQYFPRQTSGAQTVVRAALNAADPLVDYSKYDTDGDHKVDMVYFIFSGGGSNFGGNDPNLIWPHASTVMSLSLDGVSFGRYACSTELYGAPANKVLDGIGTICHEFSHVLGLPDLYDTDYEGSGGQSKDPGNWSIMAGAGYLNMSRTPAGYGLYERYALGFADPTVITEEGNYTLPAINESDKAEGYRINSTVENEFFLLETRRKTGWDSYLPGEGMLVFRVDSTATARWEDNTINTNPSHNYYELLRATQRFTSTGSIVEWDGDPFPGSGNVTALDNYTTPSLRSWTQTSTPIVLKDIAWSGDNITFTTYMDDTPVFVEDFSKMPVTSADTANVEGNYTNWDITSGARVAANEDGTHYAQMVRGSELISRAFIGVVETMAIEVENTSSTNAILRLYKSDDGVNWMAVNNLNNSSINSVSKGTKTTFNFNIGGLKNLWYRLSETTGSASDPIKVNKIMLTLRKGTYGAVNDIVADTDDSDAPERWYNLQGHPVQGNPTPGLYIRVRGSKVTKTLVR